MLRNRCELLRWVGCPLLVLVTACCAHAEERLGISEIRLADAEEAVEAADEPPSTLTLTSSEIAVPAVEEPTIAEPRPTQAAPQKPKAAVSHGRRNVKPALAVAPQPQAANSQIRQTLNFYGGDAARATLNQFPRRPPIQARPQQPVGQQIKPFRTVYHEPSISPYMNLYRDERDPGNELNYFTLVRPQLDQIDANRSQQLEIQQLSRQLQGRQRTSGGSRAAAAPGPADRNSPARYMDTAQFYGSWAR